MTPADKCTQLLASLSANPDIEAYTLTQLLDLGMPKDLALEAIHIALGGSDVIPLDSDV